MQSESGTTEAIPLDERTIAIDVGRDWKIEWGGFPLVFETWDFGGQAAYRTLHSPFLSGRCLPILVFRSTLEDGQYLSAEQLMADFLRLWLQMLHAHIPSSQVVLVCTRWGSPPAGVALEQHQTRVSALCAAVTEAVAVEMQSLNAQTVKELGDLRRQEERVAKAIGAEEERTRASGNQTHEGGGKDKGGGHGLPGQSGEHQDLKELRSIAAQIEKRLRVVTAEPEAGSEGAAQAVSVELADGRVHCVESVGGDGSTAVAVREALVKCARALPFMGQNIPKGYTAVKDACVEHTWGRVAVRNPEP
ncbi:hypothetical protein T484DRAFT_1826603 [Baffinella frigidus]|nr:hypothetical protein T484DRAFT_1826603 [Cryptophyta sp. CCMP2293]